MRRVDGYMTNGGQFFVNEEVAKQVELREDIVKGFTTRHSCTLTHVGALLLDYVVEKYELTRK